MKHERILRKALAMAARALERIAEGADAKTTAEGAIVAARNVLTNTATPEDGKITIRAACLQNRAWTWRYSGIRGKEGTVVQTVYDKDEKPVCRVLPTKSDYTTEMRVRAIAAAPEMLNALSDACHYMRAAGDCPFPACETCRIGQIMRRFDVF